MFSENVLSQIKNLDCFCEDEFNLTSGFIPLLEDLNCNGIESSIFSLKAKKLKGLFYANDQISPNSCSFDLVTYKKTEIILPNTNGLKLALNPCIKKGSIIPCEIDYVHDFNKYFPNSDYKSFTKKPKDYYFMLVQMAGYNDNKYFEFLKQTRGLISGESSPSEKFISDVRKLLPDAKNLSREFNGEQDFIEEFAQSIGSCKSCITKHPVEWVWETFLKKDLNPKDSMEITKAIEKDFTQLFANKLGPFNLERYNKMIYPQITSTIRLKKSSITFPSNILRHWDMANKKPLVNDSNIFISSIMVFDLEKIISRDNNQEITLVGFKNPCMRYTEITGTKIIIQSDTSNILFDSNREIGIIKKNKELLDREYINFLSDSIMKVLQGIVIPIINVQVPIIQNNNLNYINSRGTNFIINGNNIYGVISFNATKNKKGLFEIKTENNQLSFSLSNLKTSLEVSRALKYEITISNTKNNISTKSDEKTITIYFKYSNQ